MSASASVGRIRHVSREWRAVATLSRPWVWVAALSVLALLLRRYHLGAESLWFDEADIVRRAQQPLSTLIQGFAQAGENGPLYTLMLHYWLAAVNGIPAVGRLAHALFGSGDEAPVRALSAVFGAAGVPLIYALGQRIAGWQVGLVAAALLTFNPFDIWYSQDAKMYTLLVFTSLASSLLYLEAFRSGRIAMWVGYVAATWVMLTVHSMAGLVLLAQMAATPALWSSLRQGAPSHAPDASTASRKRLKQLWVRWGWAMLLVFGPLFPIAWLRAAALFTGTADLGGWYSSTGLTDILSTIFVNFAVNRAQPPWESIGGVVMLVLAVYGTVVLMARSRSAGIPEDPLPATRLSFGRSTSGFYLLLLWFVPIIIFWLVTLKVPLFQPRYLIAALAPYLIFVAAGALGLRRFHAALPMLAALVLALPTGMALGQVNYSSQVQKEDWRGAMGYVQDHLRLRDVIVVFPGYMVTAVDNYYHPGGPGLVPKVDIKTIPSLKTQGFGEPELNAALQNTVSCHERVWFITSPPREAQEDPLHEVQDFYQYNWHTFDTRVFNGVTVYGIGLNGQPNCWYPGPDHQERQSFTNGLEFLGYIYEIRNNNPTQPDASWFPLTMYWRNYEKLAKNYQVRVTIKDPSGKAVVDEALGPLNGYWPTTQWPPGTTVIDYRDLRLPGGLQPGDYSVSVQLYPEGHPDQPLKLKDGGSLLQFKAPLHVVPWKP